jgi:hypothetical protein
MDSAFRALSENLTECAYYPAFSHSAHGEEFEVADRQSLGLEQQVTEVLVVAPARLAASRIAVPCVRASSPGITRNTATPGSSFSRHPWSTTVGLRQ